MLSLLHIENIAVIEQADISFDKGFNVLTGETGAGKSIVIDAISAIMGERAYRDMIRTGTTKASVRAVFIQVPELSWFQENGVEYDQETVIQRDVYLDGKNVCRVNGSLVTVTILHKLGIQLINIHGQHDGQTHEHDSASLFDEENHLRFLDAFADNASLLTDYQEKYAVVFKLRREIDRMTMDESEKLRRMETLKYQIAEIEKAELQPGEDEELEQRRKLLQNSEKLSQGLDEATEALLGGDDSDGAAALLAQAAYALSRIARYSDDYSAFQERLTDLKYQVQDIADEVRDARDDLSYSADELETIESRLDIVHRLRRKYGADCKEILAYLDDYFSRAETYFSVYNLDFAKKSGRISVAAAFVGDMLGLRPIMSIIDGEIKIIEKVRGDKAVVPKLAQIAQKRRRGEHTPFFAIRAGRDEVGEELEKILVKSFGKHAVCLAEAGASITINAGPNLAGCMVMGERRK